ncbi:MAG: VOC family protein [Acidobacteria bacterium]|nr:VOC family protein [Acidobacteriota bacterium]
MAQTISMIMLGVDDANTAVEFYRNVLGFELATRFEGFAFFNAGGVTLALNEGLARAIPHKTGAVEVILPCESVHATHAALAAKGVTFLKAPAEVSPGQWAANLKDPDGHILTLFGPA